MLSISIISYGYNDNCDTIDVAKYIIDIVISILKGLYRYYATRYRYPGVSISIKSISTDILRLIREERIDQQLIWGKEISQKF